MKNNYPKSYNIQNNIKNWSILRGMLAGMILAVINIPFSISMGSVIFSGKLSEYALVGAGLVLAGCGISNIVMSMTSSFKGMISAPQSIVLALNGAMAGMIAATSTASTQTVFSTVIVSIMLSSILTGLFLYALGRFHLGDLIRYIPYPVIGGQFAGAGLLLLTGALSSAASGTIGLGNIRMLVSPEVLHLIIPAAVFAITLFSLERRYKNAYVFPAMVLFSAAVYYALVLTGLTDHAVIPEKNPAMSSSLWSTELYKSLNSANWKTLCLNYGGFLSIVFITAVTNLIKASGIEIGTEKDLDLHRELKASGAANVASGLFFGTVSFHSTSGAMIAYKLDAGRSAGLFHGVFCLAAIFLGFQFFSYFPRFIIIGIMLYLGITFLAEWVYDAYFKLSKSDYALVIAILIVSAAAGFVMGVAAGIFISAVIFVIKYSRISIIKHDLSGTDHRSSVRRSAALRDILKRRGSEIRLLILQGFIFFGTAERLYSYIRKIILKKNKPAPKYIIIDFSGVEEVDSSALNRFIKLNQFLLSEKTELIYTGLSESFREKFLLHGIIGDKTNTTVLETKDLALEWCEERIIKSEHPTEEMVTIEEILNEIFIDPDETRTFMKYLIKRDIMKGETLFRQGDCSGGLYFIESGKLSVFLDTADAVRLEVMCPGSVVGEMSLFTGDCRSARVSADHDSVLYELSSGSFEKMKIESPTLMSRLDSYIVKLISERLVHTHNEIKALMG